MTNRKSHTRFRLVPKSTTFDEYWRAITYSVSKHGSFGAQHENLNEDRLYCQRRRCSPVSDFRFWHYKVYADIRGDSLEKGVKQQWGNRKRGFSGFRTVRLRHHMCKMSTIGRNARWHFLTFFPKRLGIFSPNFKRLLSVPIYVRLQIFIQLTATLTKLCHIKRDHHHMLKMSKEYF